MRLSTLSASRAAIPGSHRLPRSSGFWAPVTQSADASGGAEAVAQLPRFSSAWANNSASLGSLRAVSSTSRLSVQAIAARRAGRLSPWQEKPVAELELYRSGAEAAQAGSPADEIAGRMDPGGSSEIVGEGIVDSKFGPVALFGFADRPAEQLGATALIDHFDQLLPTLERLG